MQHKTTCLSWHSFCWDKTFGKGSLVNRNSVSIEEQRQSLAASTSISLSPGPGRDYTDPSVHVVTHGSSLARRAPQSLKRRAQLDRPLPIVHVWWVRKRVHNEPKPRCGAAPSPASSRARRAPQSQTRRGGTGPAPPPRRPRSPRSRACAGGARRPWRQRRTRPTGPAKSGPTACSFGTGYITCTQS